MSVTTADKIGNDCRCIDDPMVWRLRSMIADGIDQTTASHLLWGRDAHKTAEIAAAGAEARRFVRDALKAAFPWLRVPS